MEEYQEERGDAHGEEEESGGAGGGGERGRPSPSPAPYVRTREMRVEGGGGGGVGGWGGRDRGRPSPSPAPRRRPTTTSPSPTSSPVVPVVPGVPRNPISIPRDPTRTRTHATPKRHQYPQTQAGVRGALIGTSVAVRRRSGYFEVAPRMAGDTFLRLRGRRVWAWRRGGSGGNTKSSSSVCWHVP